MKLRMACLVVAVLGLASVAACSGSSTETITKKIGSEGGTLELKGALLSIPAGALSEDTEITVKLEGATPDGYMAQSPVYDLNPSGLTFAVPVDLTLDFTGDSAGLAVFLTAKSGTGFEKIAGTVNGQKITAPITHFSQAFAGSSSGSGGGPIALENLMSAYLDVACHGYIACGEMSSVESCKEQLQAWLTAAGEDPFDDQKKAIAAGRMSYDGEAARRCMDAAAADSTCGAGDDIGANYADCEVVFVGKVATSGACYGDDECVAGNHCSESAMTCPGACAVSKKEGETVGPNDECEDGLKVYADKCVKAVAVGESCAPISPSTEVQPCVEGTMCAGSPLVCTAAPKENEACDARTRCGRGLNCVKAEASASTGTCKKLGDTGAACSYSLNQGCMMDLTCHLTDVSTYSGTCQARAAAGGACYATANCETGLFCDAVLPNPGVCVALKAAGDDCTKDEQCATTFCKGSTTMVCAERIAIGQPCTTEDRCVDSAQCTPATGSSTSVCTSYSCEVP